MVLSETFKEFICVVQENDKYIIGLLDDEGNVVSCSNQSDIGRKLDVNKQTSYHFFHKITVKNLDFGYLWVSSKDDNIKMMGNLLSESLHTRILYEMNEELIKSRVTKDDELVRCLLNEDEFEMDRILGLLHDLNIDGNKTRAAVYIYNKKGFNVNEILHLKVGIENKELMYSLLDNTNLLLFKDIPNNLPNTEVRPYLKKYIRKLQHWGFCNCFFVVGSLENKLKQYSANYKNCLWVKKNVAITEDKPEFFEDHMFDYFVSLVPLKEVHSIFDYRKGSKSIDVDEFIMIAGKLYENDYNITQTAEDLFLHKNSLIYKVKKYEEMFGIDIRGSFQGKLFFNLISKLFKEEKKQKQVGVKS